MYKARLSSHGRHRREVAVKTLKGKLATYIHLVTLQLSNTGDFDQLDIDKFVEESLKMGRFKHSHVMGLIGVCLDAGSAPFIIMPYMANGSLLKYLKKERDNIVTFGNEEEDEVRHKRAFIAIPCMLFIGEGSVQASDSDVLPDSKWNGILGSREVHPQRSCCQELHVRC